MAMDLISFLLNDGEGGGGAIPFATTTGTNDYVGISEDVDELTSDDIGLMMLVSFGATNTNFCTFDIGGTGPLPLVGGWHHVALRPSMVLGSAIHTVVYAVTHFFILSPLARIGASQLDTPLTGLPAGAVAQDAAIVATTSIIDAFRNLQSQLEVRNLPAAAATQDTDIAVNLALRDNMRRLQQQIRVHSLPAAAAAQDTSVAANVALRDNLRRLQSQLEVRSLPAAAAAQDTDIAVNLALRDNLRRLQQQIRVHNLPAAVDNQAIAANQPLRTNLRRLQSQINTQLARAWVHRNVVGSHTLQSDQTFTFTAFPAGTTQVFATLQRVNAAGLGNFQLWSMGLNSVTIRRTNPAISATWTFTVHLWGR